MSEPRLPAEPRGEWWRRSRRYSPFDRSPGLRRLPDNAIAFAIIGSLVVHAVLIVCVARVTEAPPWSVGADMSLFSVGDLAPSVPASPQGRAVDHDRITPASRTQTGRSTTSLRPSPTLPA